MYEYNRLQFKRKVDVVNHLQSILYGRQTKTPIVGDDFDFLMAVLDEHPSRDEKIGCGVKSMSVQYNPQYPTNRCFWLTRHDGSTTDWSFTKCIYPKTPLHDVRMAMRAAVIPQIVMFRRAYFENEADSDGCIVCPVLGIRVAINETHVDHAKPLTFKALSERFIKETGMDVNTVGVLKSDGLIGCVFADELTLQRWQIYHKHNAYLRVVSARANLSSLRLGEYDL